MRLPVVRIVHEPSAIYGGFLEINESDFDPKVHTLFDPEAKAEKAAKTGKKRATDSLANGDPGPAAE